MTTTKNPRKEKAVEETNTAVEMTKTTTNAIKGALENPVEKMTETTKAATSIANAFFLGGRKTVEGVIEVDKALFGYAREALNSYATLGRNVVNAKSMSELFDMQVAHAHDRIEQNAANTREVLDLAQTKAKEAYVPVKEAMSVYLPKKDKAA